MLTLPFRLMVKRFFSPVKSYSINEQQVHQAKVIGHFISTIAPQTPWESKCLVQAMVCRALLRLLKIPSTVYIGVATDKDGKFISHAWVTVMEVVIVGGNTSFEMYKVITKYVDECTNK